MKINQLAIQAIGEAVIPLLGYFFFDWNLYFILLFYFIDLFATEVFLNLKVKKIVEFNRGQNINKKPLLLSAISFILILFLIGVSHVAIYFILPGIDFYDEFILFMNYEELGVPIPQWMLLFPLVFFGNYQQYKMFFLMPARYRTKKIEDVFSSRLKALVIGSAGAFFAIILAYFFSLPAILYLLGIVVVKFYLDLKLKV